MAGAIPPKFTDPWIIIIIVTYAVFAVSHSLTIFSLLKYLILPALLKATYFIHPTLQMETLRPRRINHWPTIIQLAELGANGSCVSQPLAKLVSRSDIVTDEPSVPGGLFSLQPWKEQPQRCRELG